LKDPGRQIEADLRVLIGAYCQGAFPMASSRAAKGVSYYQCDPRAVFPLEPGVWSPPRSVRQAARAGRMVITRDEAFGAVIGQCANVARRLPPDEVHELDEVEGVDEVGEAAALGASEAEAGEVGDGSWINDWIISRYGALHARGIAHSVEAWLPRGAGVDVGDAAVRVTDAGEEVLVGGLYGLHLGGAFFGESMFTRADLGGSGASKACLVHLIAHLQSRGFVLLDSQMPNHHTELLGAVTMSGEEYLRRLGVALELECVW